ncbi:hypothetical protein BHE74_00044439, partial [Ensete ventricosum]
SSDERIPRRMRSGSGKAPRPAWKAVPATDDEPESAAVAAGGFRGGGAGARKKWAGPRAWLAVDAAGVARVVEAGKHDIMRWTGLPGRDLRILDPQLACPSTVLGRERATVVNLEHIKAIITAHEVLLLNYHDPSAAPFVHELQHRLRRRHRGRDKVIFLGFLDGGMGSSADLTNVYDMEEPETRTDGPCHASQDLNTSGALLAEHDENEKGNEEPLSSHGPKDLPFEFIALEACLEAACSCLENEVKTITWKPFPSPHLREYVDDTEDYINIMLDDKQNHLLQMGVMLTTATLVVSAFVALVGVFGMNIQVDLFDKKKSGMLEFLWTIGGGTFGSVFLYVIAIAWCKRRRLLE